MMGEEDDYTNYNLYDSHSLAEDAYSDLGGGKVGVIVYDDLKNPHLVEADPGTILSIRSPGLQDGRSLHFISAEKYLLHKISITLYLVAGLYRARRGAAVTGAATAGATTTNWWWGPPPAPPPAPPLSPPPAPPPARRSTPPWPGGCRAQPSTASSSAGQTARGELRRGEIFLQYIQIFSRPARTRARLCTRWCGRGTRSPAGRAR